MKRKSKSILVVAFAILLATTAIGTGHLWQANAYGYYTDYIHISANVPSGAFAEWEMQSNGSANGNLYFSGAGFNESSSVSGTDYDFGFAESTSYGYVSGNIYATSYYGGSVSGTVSINW